MKVWLLSAIIEWWNKHYFWFDVVLSFVLVVVLYTVSGKYWDVSSKCILLINDEPECILQLVITVAVTAIGFVLTGLALLLSLCDAGKFGVLVRNKYFPLVFKTYLHSVYVLAGVVAIATSWLFLKDTKVVESWMFYLLVFSLTLALCRLVRCVWIMRVLIYVILSSVKQKPVR